VVADRLVTTRRHKHDQTRRLIGFFAFVVGHIWALQYGGC
jgi:hypothetical protein